MYKGCGNKMPIVSGVSKYKDQKFETVEELEVYLDEVFEEEDEICLFSNNTKFWVDSWFTDRYKGLESGNAEYKILSKTIIEEFVKHCNEILKNGFNEFYDRIDFEIYGEDDEEILLKKAEEEICDTRDRFEELLNQDFENNTLVYWDFLAFQVIELYF